MKFRDTSRRFLRSVGQVWLAGCRSEINRRQFGMEDAPEAGAERVTRTGYRSVAVEVGTPPAPWATAEPRTPAGEFLRAGFATPRVKPPGPLRPVRLAPSSPHAVPNRHPDPRPKPLPGPTTTPKDRARPTSTTDPTNLPLTTRNFTPFVPGS